MAATLRDVTVATKPTFDTLACVTSHPAPTAVRRAARMLALVPAILVTSLTSTAFAEAPEQWEDTAARLTRCT